MTMTATHRHPAPYHPNIVAVFAELIVAHIPLGCTIHDPFGGDGIRLGALCDRLAYPFSATDLECWPGADIRMSVADATLAGSYPSTSFAVVTSPTYNNGVNDHFKPGETSKRITYRVAAGHALDETNTGRWSGRGSGRAEREYWRLHRLAVAHWPDVVIVNVKDSIRDGGVYPLVQQWALMLNEHGYAIVDDVSVHTPGHRHGTNHAARVDDERVLVGVRQHPPCA